MSFDVIIIINFIIIIIITIIIIIIVADWDHTIMSRQADEAYNIGPPAASQSYLRQDAIMGVAKQSGAQVTRSSQCVLGLLVSIWRVHIICRYAWCNG